MDSVDDLSDLSVSSRGARRHLLSWNWFVCGVPDVSSRWNEGALQRVLLKGLSPVILKVWGAHL